MGVYPGQRLRVLCGWRKSGSGICWIGGLLAQGLAPGAAARLGVYLHGTAGDVVTERLGDAGLLASDLPDAVPMVRKRLAAIAERTKSGKRLGFSVREGDGAGA